MGQKWWFGSSSGADVMNSARVQGSGITAGKQRTSECGVCVSERMTKLVTVLHFSYGPDDDFQLMQRNFLEKHYQEFDDSEENKLIYTDIFNEYVRYLFLFFICITVFSGFFFNSSPFIKYWAYME